MANIKTYEDAVPAPKPNDEAASVAREAGLYENRFIHQGAEAIGGAISKVGGQIGQVVDQHNAMSDISSLSAAAAQQSNALTDAWNQAVKAPGAAQDPSIRANFVENTLEPTLEKLQDAASTPAGQKYALDIADRMRDHFDIQTRADQSALSGVAAVQNMQTVLTHTSDMARGDPTSASLAHDLITSSMEGIIANSPTMSVEDAAKLRAEFGQKAHAQIDIASFEGKADANPEAALKELAAGNYGKYVDSADLTQMQHYGEAVIRLNRQDAALKLSQDRERQQQASEARASQYLATIGKNGGQVPDGMALQILKDPSLKPAEKTGLFSFAQSEQGKDNPQATNTFLKGLSLPSSDPGHTTVGQVLAAVGSGGANSISKSDAQFIINQMNAPDAGLRADAFATGRNTLEHAIAPKDGFGNLTQGANQAQADKAQADALQKYSDGLSRGLAWQDMLLPGGKDYIFTKDFISHYQGQLNTSSPLAVPASSKPVLNLAQQAAKKKAALDALGPP